MPSSYSHRVVTFPMDALAMAIVKLGSGSNLLGYYRYAGGTNPNDPSKGIFLNETTRSRYTAHNDLPPFSFGFSLGWIIPAFTSRHRSVRRKRGRSSSHAFPHPYPRG